jgi:peptide deformylase
MLIKITDILHDSIEPLPVLTWGNMKLGQPISGFEIKLFKKDVERMVKTCLLEDGIGLSANQVGINKNFFVMRVSENEFGAFFSPIWRPGIRSELEKNKEGCLSAVGKIYMVARPNAIEASWWGLNGKDKPMFFTEKLKGLVCRCFIHESQHLLLKTIADDGKLVTDPV